MLTEGRRLFGTDGIRGRANKELTADLAVDLARALGEGLAGPVLIGRDTRRSGQMLVAALEAGFHSVGVDTVNAGIIPTGGISYLTRDVKASYGVVVSASHNPAEDNGIKFIGPGGAKLSDEREDAIEARLRRGSPYRIASGGAIGIGTVMGDEALARYISHLASGVAYSLQGMEFVLDCAHGAAFRAAPMLFERLQATVEVHGAEPDGTNINSGCGATHPQFLAARVDGRVGLAFDGDADRLIAVDEDGMPANGDVVMAVIAAHLKEAGKLKGNRVVVTTMSNLGFRLAMQPLGIDVVETAVGDRYVLEAMREHRAVVGGEQSGHVIFEERITGDGLLTALRLAEVMAATGKPLTELRAVMTELPQVLRNIHVTSKERLGDSARVTEAVQQVETELGSDGRILVRASGTEPLVRVMVEAPTGPEAARLADQVADIVRSELG